jgi:tetratricopeptide (TPR) repeat protein
MRSLQSYSSKEKDWCAQGRELMQSKQYRKAVHAFDKAIGGNTAHTQAYFFRGVCHYLMGNYQLANSDMDAATILGYRDAQFWSKFEMKGTRSGFKIVD